MCPHLLLASLAAVLLGGCGVVSETESDPTLDTLAVGYSLPGDARILTIDYFSPVWTEPFMTYGAYSVEREGVTYLVGGPSLSESDPTVHAIQTRDSSFVTPEGVRVGTPRDRVLAAGTLALRSVRGLSRDARQDIVTSPSGWNASVVVVDRDGSTVDVGDQTVGVLFRSVNSPGP